MTRWHSLLVLLALALATLFAGCSSGGGGGLAPAVVRGLVTHANGTAFSNVAISSGSANTSSGVDGSYTLSVAPGANRKITASSAGFVDTFEVLDLAAGQTVPVDFSLNSVGQSTRLTGLLATPTAFAGPGGSEISFAANSLVDSTGAAMSAATVAITVALPSDANFAASFPGRFVGTIAGVDTAIESFGFVTIEFTSDAGLACNLRPGATAIIAIPVAPSSDPGTPTIDLWSLDETTGKWVVVGPATRGTSGGTTVYRSPVTHFSAYNLDRPILQSGDLLVEVKDSGGSLVAGASVVLASRNPTGGAWEGRGVTEANGVVDFPSVPTGDVLATALAGSQVGSGLYGLVFVDGIQNSITIQIQ